MKTPKAEEKTKYRNREIDWLNFNYRVLQEAMDKTNPLMERIKFLAIFSSNLDEFFRVRVSKLRQIKKIKKSVRKPLELKPNKLLRKILVKVHKQQELFGQVYREQIVPKLKEHDIHILEAQNFNEKQIEFLQTFFHDKIAPYLKIIRKQDININSFENGKLYIMAVTDPDEELHFIPVESQIDSGRFIELPPTYNSFSTTFLEDVIKLNADLLFPEKRIKSMYNLKISRDAELYLEDEYEGEWIQQIYDSLAERQKGQPTRLLYENKMPKSIQKKIRELLGLGKVDMVQGGERHNFSDFFGFKIPMEKPELYYKPLPPLSHRKFEKAGNYFELIKDQDQIIHFPYQSFNYLEKWVAQAASDEKVTTIKISLYRVAKDSNLTNALLRALENEKQVTLFVEAKARFDESNNLKWGKTFEEKGGKVFYSFPNVKVHSKILYVERKEEKGFQAYAYIGTGNFNAKTAKIYCDHGLFTASTKITNDLGQVFRVLERELLVPKLKTLLVSPYNSRLGFEQLIQNEIENANNGKFASISAKMNSLEDKRMIDWLYKASNAGVQINLIVRGFCCLIPGIEGLSENIRVTSIVDRFLEHDRIFLFQNGGKEKMYMGSADWMTRNLDKRIEVITPILDSKVFHKLKQILKIQFSDNVKARLIDSRENNCIEKRSNDEKIIRSQYALYEFLKIR